MRPFSSLNDSEVIALANNLDCQQCIHNRYYANGIYIYCEKTKWDGDELCDSPEMYGIGLIVKNKANYLLRQKKLERILNDN